MRPFVSRAAINDNLGVTDFRGIVADASAGHHIFLAKLVSLIQLSSMFRMQIPSYKRGKIFNAYCCLSTRHRSELAWIGIFLTYL